MGALLPYDPNACGCCGCPVPLLERQQKTIAGGYEVAEGNCFQGFTTGALYRTRTLAGWGAVGGSDIVEHANACTFATYAAAVSGGGTAKVYGTFTTAPWSPGAPAATYTACADFDANLFALATPPVSDARQLATDLGWPAMRGHRQLANAITYAQLLAEIHAALDAAGWAAFAVSGDATASYQVDNSATAAITAAVRRARYRFRFPVPAVGGYRVRWVVQRLVDSLGATPTIHEEAEWNWDREVPGDYDAGDPETWPVSPWFELPDAAREALPSGATGLYYRVAGIEAACGATAPATAPAAVSGHAA